MHFKNLNLIEPILKALIAEGYTIPTPIQQQSIPHILAGRDLQGCAQTGTGKTAAFALPIIQHLFEQKQHRPGIKVLVLTPTRELAIQIDESFVSYGKYTNLKHTVVYGGVSQLHQVNALKKGIEVLIATPGRLLDLIDQGFINLSRLEIFVLDEADRMLDMGFIHDVKRVIALLPQKRQTLFFSATMPPAIQKLAKSLLVNPAKVEVTPPTSTVEKIEQSLYHTNKSDKPELLFHLLNEQLIETALVFTRTKHGADRVVKYLLRMNVKAAAIHGNKSQNNRQAALSNFKTGQLRVLVATDIAARGIDIDELTHVFNYDLPDVPETYIHRIGRTGRAGKSGNAIAFCDVEEKSELNDIEKLIGKKIPVVDEHPFKPLTAHFVSKQAPVSSNRPQKRQWNSHRVPSGR
ncbi:MAG: DEAD/DEAH box helicase [Bacteroidales bacterium]|nr:DEAD/DEAH box helicase [Bacteroidales bacterium]